MNGIYGLLFGFFAQADKAPLIVPDSVQKANFAEAVRKLANLDVDTLLQNLLSQSIWILVKILIALGVYFIGRWNVHRLINIVDAIYERRQVASGLRSFLAKTSLGVFMRLLVL